MRTEIQWSSPEAKEAYDNLIALIQDIHERMNEALLKTHPTPSPRAISIARRDAFLATEKYAQEAANLYAAFTRPALFIEQSEDKSINLPGV